MVAGARGKGRPKLTETAEIDRAIRDAAIQVLLEHGEAATMNAVALAAGISRKSLYARYPNKAELFTEVIRDLLKPAAPLACPSDGTAENRLAVYIETALAAIALPQSLAVQRLLRMNPAYISELRGDMMDATRRILGDPLEALLDELTASGELAIDDVPATTRAVIGLILAEGLAVDEDITTRPPERQSPDATFLTRFITRGLLPR